MMILGIDDHVLYYNTIATLYPIQLQRAKYTAKLYVYSVASKSLVLTNKLHSWGEAGL